MPKAFIVVACSLAILFVVFYHLETKDQETTAKVLIQRCELGKEACTVNLPAQNKLLSFQLSPFPVKPLEPVHLKVDFTYPDIIIVKSWFEGVQMDMGLHFLLPDTNQSLVKTKYTASGMIPICTLDENMNWKLMVEVEVGTALYILQFNL